MKNKTLHTLLIIVICFGLIASSIISVSAATQVNLRYITLNDNKNLYLEIGDIVNLNVGYFPKGATAEHLSFSSSKENIVKVSSTGVLKALTAGTAKVTAMADGKSSTITVTVNTNNNLRASFTEAPIVADKIYNITIDVTSKQEDESEFSIFLPTGYLVKGKTATFAADKNGTYPFTVYDSSGKKKTFYYEINKIKDNKLNDINSKYTEDEINEKLNSIYDSFTLQYDYEKKQLLFNAYLDSYSDVVLPNKSAITTNEINYYISDTKNGELVDYNFIIDEIPINCRLVKQGEFYLLMLYRYYSDIYNVYTINKAYNFTVDEEIQVYPDNLFMSGNDTYDITAYSDSGLMEVFSLPIDNLDYVRPKVSIAILYTETLELSIVDNKSLDYIITFDGKYVDIPDSYVSGTTYVYNDNQPYVYSGNYMYIVADKSGNRTIASIELTDLKKVPNNIYKLNKSVHNSNVIDNIFKEQGDQYDGYDEDAKYFSNIFPSYMKGVSSNTFDPNGSITRAQMVTILCRINNLPYDINLLAKSKFTDINNHWAINYICMGNAKKYIKGYKDKTFKPDDNLTRAEFCKMICNISALKSSITSIPSVNNYTFNDINSNFAKADILKLANRDIVKGVNESFYPDKPITRAEVVYAINRLYKLNPSTEELKYIKSLYNKYYSYYDIANNTYFDDLVIAITGMYREK